MCQSLLKHSKENQSKPQTTDNSVFNTQDTLISISDATSGCVGDEYFKALAIATSRHFDMDFVIIGELDKQTQQSIHTKVFVANGKITDNITYELKGTPCEKLLKRSTLVHPSGIQEAYPQDTLLQTMNIESYVGTTLFSNSGAPIGILVALGRQTIKQPEQLGTCFKTVADRTAAEMERTIVEEDIHKLSKIINQSPVTVMVTDTEGNLEYVNEHFEKTSGYSSSDVIGRNARILKSGHSANDQYPQLWEALKKGKTWVGELQNKRKDGSLYWERGSFGAIKNAQGKIINYVAIKEDITKEKEAEKEARLASAVFETATEAVMITDTHHKIIKVNSAFTRITGYNAAEVLGESPSILKSGHHKQSFYDDMFKGLAANDNWRGEIWNRRKNGEAYPEWLAISAMRDSSGELEGYVSLFSDISKRKQDEARILHQANFDALTGLPNRSLFADRLSRALEQAERDNNNLALLFIGLDSFKSINETLGHAIGDQLLQEVSSRLLNELRKSDTVARLGSDEFAVVISGKSSLHNIEDIVTSTLGCIAAPYSIQGHDAFLSASIGVSVYPQDGLTTESLLRKADAAMHRAKDNGRNNAQYFTLGMEVEAEQRRELEKMLRQAIDDQQFTLNYQPIVDTTTGKINSAEALIRWTHPTEGVISPANFIPFAEEKGLILLIGEWVLNEACKTAASWLDHSDHPPSVSVNLSSYQLQRQNISQLLQNVLATSGLPAEKLTLEITESLLLADDEETLRQLQSIRQLGVKLSIDDFGTGYSSLSYLKKFPISNLKIDRSFIMGLPASSEDAALVKAIVLMGESLNLNVIAEGIETQQQADFLKSLNCKWVQGFLYSKPLSKTDFLNFLKVH